LLEGFGLKAERYAGARSFSRPSLNWIDALGHSFIESLVVDLNRSMRGVGFSPSPSAKDPADSPSSAQLLGAGRKPQIHFGFPGDTGCKGESARAVSDRSVLRTLNNSNSTIRATDSPVRRLN
jgi:hypothetical protein